MEKWKFRVGYDLIFVKMLVVKEGGSKNKLKTLKNRQ